MPLRVRLMRRHQEINTYERRCPLGTVLSEILDKVVFDVREPNFGKRVQLKLPSSSTYHEIVDGIIKVTGLPEGISGTHIVTRSGESLSLRSADFASTKSAAKMSVVVTAFQGSSSISVCCMRPERE